MNKTIESYREVTKECSDLFEKKLIDYGSSWRVLRTPSVTDQIYIKAARIRSIQELEETKVDEGQESEFIGIVNYCIIALIQHYYPVSLSEIEGQKSTYNPGYCMRLYSMYLERAFELMEQKNHDYGEAWRDLRVTSITDLILQKLFRVRQIEDNKGKTIVSEGLEANYLDILNYAVFSLILLKEESNGRV